MGAFANTLFSVLLGWIQSAVSWLWRLMSSEEAGGLMGWVLENWLLLAILLCAVGLAVDLIVYLLRWQPYRVWRSFWRRMSDRQKASENPDPAQTGEPVTEPRQWLYADGSMVYEEAPDPAAGQRPAVDHIAGQQAEMRLKAPVRPARRVIPARRRRAADGSDEYILPDMGSEQQAYHQPCYPPQWRTQEQQAMNRGDRE